MNLFEYAFCKDFDKKLEYLSKMSPERWSFNGGNDNCILKNYISHTFSKISEENKIATKDNVSLFNTGLYTQYYEPIYAYFTKNRNSNKQEWFLESFYTQYQLASMGISNFPVRANYFEDPGQLVFNTNLEIIPQYQHIFDDADNFNRIPEVIRNSPSLKIIFDGAIKKAKQQVDANYKTAVPQYYKGKIQLLIPLCLINPDIPDLALVVSKDESGTQYLGHTCLTLEMAYNNARLIAKPDSAWLVP